MTAKQEEHSILSFMAWLVWIAAATVVLGGAAYLFVGGSVLFSQQNTTPIVVYRQVGAASMSLSGSIVLGSSCETLGLANTGDAVVQTLNFTIEGSGVCNEMNNSSVPETFFIELEGNLDTRVQAIVNGKNRDIIIK